MSNKIKATSSLSADSTEVRYQKALKQINKLIGVNTELRQEASKNQEYLNQMQEKMDNQTEEYNRVLEAKERVQAELKNALTQRLALAKQNQELKKQLNKLKSLKLSDQSRIGKKQTIESNLDNDRLSESHKTIHELQKMLQNKQQTIRQLIKRVKSFESTFNNQYGQRTSISQAVKSTLNTNDLTKKLHAATSYIDKVQMENVNLKSRLIKAESSNKLMTVRSMEALSKYSPQVSPRNNFNFNYMNGQPRNSEEVLKRYKHLQDEHRKFTKKIDHLKSDNAIYSEQNSRLKKQNAKFSTQITQYEALITKQQSIIQQLHLTYDKEIKSMTQEFKQKLLDQRQNFSPAKSADHLKTIQSLQSQIKALKKKLQLYQIQLTKYIKTLEAYKSKLNECEKDVQQLMTERDHLRDRLTKLQSSHRERSNHSRGSASRIVDNQRRNSMGDTGYFNYS